MPAMKVTGRWIRNFEQLGRGDVALVGGKNSSLGEMIRALAPKGIAVPPGFATTAEAYWYYVDANNIREKMAALIEEWQSGKTALAEVGYAVQSFPSRELAGGDSSSHPSRLPGSFGYRRDGRSAGSGAI
jgi:hypothetical protein